MSFKGLKPIVYGGKEVWPLIEGGKGVSATNHMSSGAWAAAGGIGTTCLQVLAHGEALLGLVRLGAEALERYRTQVRDVYAGIDETDLDRIVLDLPEPWQVVPHAETALRRGGIFLAYTPSIIQVSQLHEAFEDSRFGMVETLEVLHRGWYLNGTAVRPDHRMVGHTGFLTHARLLAE